MLEGLIGHVHPQDSYLQVCESRVFHHRNRVGRNYWTDAGEFIFLIVAGTHAVTWHRFFRPKMYQEPNGLFEGKKMKSLESEFGVSLAHCRKLKYELMEIASEQFDDSYIRFWLTACTNLFD